MERHYDQIGLREPEIPYEAPRGWAERFTQSAMEGSNMYNLFEDDRGLGAYVSMPEISSPEEKRRWMGEGIAQQIYLNLDEGGSSPKEIPFISEKWRMQKKPPKGSLGDYTFLQSPNLFADLKQDHLPNDIYAAENAKLHCGPLGELTSGVGLVADKRKLGLNTRTEIPHDDSEGRAKRWSGRRIADQGNTTLILNGDQPPWLKELPPLGVSQLRREEKDRNLKKK